MRQYKSSLIVLACLCSAIAIVSATPLPANQELDVLQIPLADGKEIDVLTLGSKDQEQMIADRNKRTIGLLRELFPDITKALRVCANLTILLNLLKFLEAVDSAVFIIIQIDAIVNRIIAQVIRVAGPSLLPALLGNNNRGAATERSSFDAAFDDDDDDEDDADSNSNANDISSNNIEPTNGINFASRVNIDLPTFAPETNNVATSTTEAATTTSTTTEAATTTTTTAAATTTTEENGASDTQIDLSAINKQLEETIRVARQVKEAEAAAQSTSSLPQLKHEESIQLSFNNEVLNINDNSKSNNVNNDLQLSESKSPAIDELTLDSNEDAADLDDRNKRFLSFGGGAGAGLAGGSSGGSSGSGAAGGAGGSGNFLFDIVRLFSGSVQTQAGDAAANSGSNSVGDSSSSGGDSDAQRAADGYTEGIPGPVTRLVVLANRGLANLVQDLILRVAATSEKFVNFKAKLITALI